MNSDAAAFGAGAGTGDQALALPDELKTGLSEDAWQIEHKGRSGEDA
ncbi:hypothetical protein ACIBHY_02265 [Nonomuraea sp. NPDC050547]